jgi:hypothetical protein
VIEQGDTLYKIARELQGAGIESQAGLSKVVGDIIGYNPAIQGNPNYIKMGDSLSLPAEWISALQPQQQNWSGPIPPFLPNPPLHSWDPAIDILRQLGGVNDLEAMARIADAYARLYPSWELFLSQMSNTFLGVPVFGPATLVEAAIATRLNGCIGKGREPHDCPANEGQPYFQDTGFHLDYQDGHNQPYHVWGFIAQTAYPFDEYTHLSGVCFAHAGNIFHDIIQSRRFLAHEDGYGASWQDYFLSLAGIEIGSAISYGVIESPQELGRVLLKRLGPDGPGSSGSVHWWEEHWDIAPLEN